MVAETGLLSTKIAKLRLLAFERLGNAAPCDTKSSVQSLTEPDRRRSSCHALESSIA